VLLKYGVPIHSPAQNGEIRGGEWGWLSVIILSELEICTRVGWWDGKAGQKLVQNNRLELGPKSELFPAHPDLDQLPADDVENSLGYSLSQSRQGEYSCLQDRGSQDGILLARGLSPLFVLCAGVAHFPSVSSHRIYKVVASKHHLIVVIGTNHF